MLRPTRIILALVLVSASVPGQQADKNTASNAVRDMRSVGPQAMATPQNEIKLSQEKGAWVVRIDSGGGFHGRGNGGLTITSEGNLTSTMPEAACEARLESPVLEMLAQLARSARPFNSIELNTSVCSDCYQTSIVLRRREADGSERTYMAYWDDSTKKKIPAEIIKIYDAILNARHCK